ncbi:hypothetical protein ABB37_01113 [Leptomonas pyrrhocoris]|uniref:4'-phosphopantetheinyl transferase domain-containing protein n=1 Tax=Leptomonas pyrrhocoris TaxID=157538 RepID=A0A0M9G7Z0_LEPPY|nr:hypothetical protein ABB37_01113 [Leptomonas pyrrhocoris]KPA84580.1 hypothetical protein ABB37_01113 [Leptomonas pyrrhocoris]|eukprot:XP_015663019.1 hypothetical protein ABB37_01113 [Leptomonas pyrrhocoris]
MRALRKKSTTQVIHRAHALPQFPFRGATAVVSRLTTPRHRAPPLRTLCSTALDGFDSAEGALFCRAAEGLHLRHQLPFVLSRVAASSAIETLRVKSDEAHGERGRVVFTGSRRSARALHGCELSLSHEDCVAAAVAWAPDACSASSGSTTPPRSDVARGDACASSVSQESNVHNGGRIVCAIDVCPVAEVHRVRRRFPQLGRRWMPQCVTDASASAVSTSLRAAEKNWPEQTINTDTTDFRNALHVGSDVVDAQSRRRDWWRLLPRMCTSEREAYTSLVLAQHWGARECVIKLLGISGRSFSYACVHHHPQTAAGESCSSALPFTTAFLHPHTLYRGMVGGSEQALWQREGLDPTVHFYSWVEWCPHSATADMPYAVVVGCCSAHYCAPCR